MLTIVNMQTVHEECPPLFFPTFFCLNYLSVPVFITLKLRKTVRKKQKKERKRKEKKEQKSLLFITGQQWRFQSFSRLHFPHFLCHYPITSHYNQTWFPSWDLFQLDEIIVFDPVLQTVCFSIGVDLTKLYSVLLCEHVLIDGEEWNLCLHLAEGRGVLLLFYICTQAQGPANSVSYPSNKRSFERRWCVLLCVTVLPGEVFLYIYIFFICLVVRPLPALSMHCCSLGILSKVSARVSSQKPQRRPLWVRTEGPRQLAEIAAQTHLCSARELAHACTLTAGDVVRFVCSRCPDRFTIILIQRSWLQKWDNQMLTHNKLQLKSSTMIFQTETGNLQIGLWYFFQLSAEHERLFNFLWLTRLQRASLYPSCALFISSKDIFGHESYFLHLSLSPQTYLFLSFCRRLSSCRLWGNVLICLLDKS